MPVGWAPTPAEAVEVVASWARPADLVAHGRRRRRGRRRPCICSSDWRGGEPSRRRGERRALPLHDARHGRARTLRSRSPRRRTSWSSSCAGRPQGAFRSRRSGSARTCSSPTSGFPGLALKLAGDLAAARGRGRPARGRRRRPARRLPPPGARRRTRRVRVRVRDPRHGRRRRLDERGRVRERHVGRCSSARSSRTRRAPRWLTPDELGLRYRRSALERGQVVAPGGVPARAAARRRDQGDRRRDAGASARPRSRRTSGRSAASSRTPSTSSPPGGCSRRAACAASRSAAPASRPSTRTSSRTRATRRSADAVALIAEARRRALEQFGVRLEPEVQLLGAVEIPPFPDT